MGRQPGSAAALMACAWLLLMPGAAGQTVVAARAGLVNFFEGAIFLDGQPLVRKPGTDTRLQDGSTLLTEAGRAEVLLTPGTYLRLGENGSIRMLSSGGAGTRVELLGGSAIVDSSRAQAVDSVDVVFRDATLRVVKPGHYRIDADPPQLRVDDGEVEVARGDKPVTVAAAEMMRLDGATVVRLLTPGSDRLLDLWSEERGSLLASSLVNPQTIWEPLLYYGPHVAADLPSYTSYAPLLPRPDVPVFLAYPRAPFYTGQYRYTPLFVGRPGVPFGAPRPGIPSRPVLPAPRAGGHR